MRVYHVRLGDLARQHEAEPRREDRIGNAKPVLEHVERPHADHALVVIAERLARQVARVRCHVAHLVPTAAQLAPQRADDGLDPADMRSRVVGYEQDPHRSQTRMRPPASKIHCCTRNTASASSAPMP